MLGRGDLRDLMTGLNKMGTYYHQTCRYLATILRLFAWNSAVSRWRLRPGEGITDSQGAARFDEADIKRALFGIEEASKSN